MPYLTGLVIGGVVGLLGRLAGFDRDRAFYPVVLIVTASYYVLFAVMGGSTPAVLVESAVGIAFASVAVVAFRSSLWFVAAAMAGHAVFDLLHDWFIFNPGVPSWWPAFCLAIDVFVALFLAWLLYSARVRTRIAAASA